MLNNSSMSTAPSADRSVAQRALVTPLAVMALVFAGCQAPTAQPSSATDTTAAEQSTEPPASTTATVTAEPTASPVVGNCLDEDVMDAIQQAGSGDLDTDPPITEVADQLDTLELDGRPADFRDRLVSALRASPTVQDDIAFAAVPFLAEVPVDEC